MDARNDKTPDDGATFESGRREDRVHRCRGASLLFCERLVVYDDELEASEDAPDNGLAIMLQRG
jgi:hypothetical protein